MQRWLGPLSKVMDHYCSVYFYEVKILETFGDLFKICDKERLQFTVLDQLSQAITSTYAG